MRRAGTIVFPVNWRILVVVLFRVGFAVLGSVVVVVDVALTVAARTTEAFEEHVGRGKRQSR